MNVIAIDEDKLKDVIKTAIVELLEERRDLLDNLLDEALADIGFVYAIQSGERTPSVSREQVFEILEAS